MSSKPGKHEKAKRDRVQLIEELGGRCVDCGTADFLELDHVVAARWKPRTLNYEARIREYRAQKASGNLAVRCKTCNKAKRRTNGEF